MILAIIPARFASTRFPGKPLVLIQGKSMIQRVYEQVKLCKKVDKIVVATDDLRIFEAVEAFGGEVMMTKSDHVSGTDRCAEVARKYKTAQFILNVQGDEPFVQPEQIDLLIATLQANKQTQIATLAKKIEKNDVLFNPNSVKVVFGEDKLALYFSRHPIPYLRGQEQENWLNHQNFYKHIGLYGFQRKTLLKIAKLQPSTLEKAESLEQLRWLENGYKIGVGITELETVGIDTPEDIILIENL
jgi:3-deoxy-manno-octulosonate cytidylyltransferase (CMP-KDO synthetase)